MKAVPTLCAGDAQFASPDPATYDPDRYPPEGRTEMKRFLLCSIAALVACSLIGSAAMAIPPSNSVSGSRVNSGGGSSYYPSRATVSPYVTLARGYGGFGGGAYAGLNYYTFIRPGQQQMQFNQQQTYMMNQLQTQQYQMLNGQQPIYGQNGLPAIRATGSRSWFMTQQPYFGVGAGAGTNGGGNRGTSSMQSQRPAY